MSATNSLSEYAATVPLSLLRAAGAGRPHRRSAQVVEPTLASLRSSREGVEIAVSSIGETGYRLLLVLSALGGSASLEELTFQVGDLDSGVLATAIDRLEMAELVLKPGEGGLSLVEQVQWCIPPTLVSFSDQGAITSEGLRMICEHLGLDTPSRKYERVEALTAAFASPVQAKKVREGLSAESIQMLDRIVDGAGPGSITAEALGVSAYGLANRAQTYYRYQDNTVSPEVTALQDLAQCGIIGISDWEQEIWVWREAWPIVGRPFFGHWQHIETPKKGPVPTSSQRVPGVVTTCDQAMKSWEATPPPVLKNSEVRMAKTVVRPLAKSLGVDQESIDLCARLVIDIGLLLPNVVSQSGRGRRKRIDRVWMGDPTMLEAWSPLNPMERWVRLLAHWCQPLLELDRAQLDVRHLVIWDLASLRPGQGYLASDDEYSTWFAHHHGPFADVGLVKEALKDIRTLGLSASSGPIALTQLGLTAIVDSSAPMRVQLADATKVIVQADLTVIAPPDLRHDIGVRISTLAVVESEAGAVTYRLDPKRIISTIQGGADPAELVDFLADVSSVPLTDSVFRLVSDAERDAGKVKVVSAATVVVVTDPVDLMTACSIKAAKLNAISETVAVSEVGHQKVRAALERKGLAPEVIVGTPTVTARSSADAAQDLRGRANQYRELADGVSGDFYARHADSLEASANKITDSAERLAVGGPLGFTPKVLESFED